MSNPDEYDISNENNEADNETSYENETAAGNTPEDDKRKIITLERASFVAWQKKDKAFYEDYLADTATWFWPWSPYLETEPKLNFLPKFELWTQVLNIQDFQMYNERVDLYGDVGVLTYGLRIAALLAGRPVNYTSKLNVVFNKQKGKWRVVNWQESMNPGML